MIVLGTGIIKIVKRLVSIFLAIALLEGVFMAVQSQEIMNPIDRVVSAGLMNKDASGNFNAQGLVSRADLAMILVKTFGLERRKTAQKPDRELPDVPKSYWAYSAIQTALKTGTMSGYRDGMFFPNQRVTRAEALAIFAQAYGVFQFPESTISEILAKYPDAGEIPNWARKSIATALYEGFVNVDVATNKINPLKPMSRGDIAYALSKYLERQLRPTSLPVPDEEPPNRGMGR
ncbi:S-layer homology domain-containing protein [Microcoleus vaginatus HSN003]|nr:S-layer homology domain-containing protein [Microcoleus vaginatus HSN003]